MTIDEILAKVENFRSTGPGKGIGRCGAFDHPDIHRSMNVQDAGDKILLYCQSRNCSIEAICAGLGIEVSDLFVDPPPKRTTSMYGPKMKLPKVTVSPYQTSNLLRGYAHKLLDIADAYEHHSWVVLDQAQGMKIDSWTDEQLDGALAIVARAQKKQELVFALEDLAFDLKTHAMEREKSIHAT